MKRITLIIAACCLILTACAQNANNNANKQPNNNTMKKTLIVYFSATGITKAAAQKLAKEFNADIYVLDITDTANPQVLATVKTADWITAEWPNGANSADILLREGEGVIEMYVVHSGLATIAKFIFNP